MFIGRYVEKTSKIIKNESVVTFDIDQTLLMDVDENNWPGRKVQVYHKASHKFMTKIIHEPHLKLLIEQADRGMYIILWSQRGFEWARAAAIALEIMPIVDLIITKPRTYVDDKKCKEWMGPQIYLNPKAKY